MSAKIAPLTSSSSPYDKIVSERVGNIKREKFERVTIPKVFDEFKSLLFDKTSQERFKYLDAIIRYIVNTHGFQYVAKFEPNLPYTPLEGVVIEDPNTRKFVACYVKEVLESIEGCCTLNFEMEFSTDSCTRKVTYAHHKMYLALQHLVGLEFAAVIEKAKVSDLFQPLIVKVKELAPYRHSMGCAHLQSEK